MGPRLLLALLAVAAWFLGACAETDIIFPVNTVTSRLGYKSAYLIDRFGFERDGIVNLRATISSSAVSPFHLDNSTFQVHMCSAEALAEQMPDGSLVPLPGFGVAGYCDWPVPRSCHSVNIPLTGVFVGVVATTSFARLVTDPAVYYFILDSCRVSNSFATASLEAKVEYTLHNPGTGYLGTQYSPLLVVLPVLVLVWFGLLILHTHNTFKYRPPVQLHWHWCMALLFKVLSLLLAYCYWQARASGASNSVYADIWYPVWVGGKVLYRGLFFTALLVTAKGLDVIRRRLPIGHIWSLASTVTMYCLASFSIQVWSLVSSVALMSALVSAVTFVLLVYSIWHNARVNLHVLYTQAIFFSGFTHPEFGDVSLKYNIYRSLRSSLVIYLFCQAASDVMGRSTLFVERLPYIAVGVDEAVEVLFVAICVYLFRARRAASTVFLPPVRALRPTQPAPVAEPASREHPNVVVVTNPDGKPALGFAMSAQPARSGRSWRSGRGLGIGRSRSRGSGRRANPLSSPSSPPPPPPPQRAALGAEQAATLTAPAAASHHIVTFAMAQAHDDSYSGLHTARSDGSAHLTRLQLDEDAAELLEWQLSPGGHLEAETSAGEAEGGMAEAADEPTLHTPRLDDEAEGEEQHTSTRARPGSR